MNEWFKAAPPLFHVSGLDAADLRQISRRSLSLHIPFSLQQRTEDLALAIEFLANWGTIDELSYSKQVTRDDAHQWQIYRLLGNSRWIAFQLVDAWTETLANNCLPGGYEQLWQDFFADRLEGEDVFAEAVVARCWERLR